MMNNPDTLKMATSAAGANCRRPTAQGGRRRGARVGRRQSESQPQEIAEHKSDFLAQTAGGLSMSGSELAEDRRNWMKANPGKTFADMIADKPELADETTYVAIKGEQGKQAAESRRREADRRSRLSAVPGLCSGRSQYRVAQCAGTPHRDLRRLARPMLSPKTPWAT